MRRLKSKFKKLMFLGYFLFIMTALAVASDVIVKNGEMNITSNLVVDSNTLYVDSMNNRVGIGTATPAKELHVIGDANITKNLSVGGQLKIDGASRFEAYIPGDQSVNTVTWTLLNFSTEYYDNLGEFSTVNKAFTPLQSGYYLITARALLSSATAGTEMRIYVYVNGAPSKIGSYNGLSPHYNYQSVQAAGIQYLAAGDNVTVYAYHNCGTAKSFIGGTTVSEFSMHRLS
jgi:hypothetical protein